MPSRDLPRWMLIWNRKLHIYISLYLLLFVWLFSVSGLLLNHPKWKFAQFWPQRKQSSFEQPIQPPVETGDLAKARDLMRQLNISGEISSTTTHPKEDRFDFRVTTPEKIIDIKTNLKAKRATVEQIQVNGWGVLHLVHTFTGVRMNEPREKRDWLVTKLWSLSMDAVCIGLLFLVLSSLMMWYQIMEKRRLGLFLLVIGVLGCGFFVFGLAWIK